MGFPADARNVYMHASLLSNVRPPEAPPQDFGFGAGSNYTSIAAHSFIGRNNNAALPWEYNAGLVGCCENISRVGTETFMDAEFQLPPRVTIQSIRYWAHDANAADDIAFFIFESCAPTASAGAHVFTIIAQGATSGSGGYQGGLLSGTGIEVNTRDCVYKARVRFDATTSQTFHKFRVEWRRTVSTAPGVATFLDVPTTHFFFRWIEALAASGITAGCGGGNFCPDQAVTRAQMAVFLSVALGLYAQ
jgi:hypothetical protein